jgi:transposase
MTTMTRRTVAVTAGVDTHLDVHVAAVVNDLGAVLGTRSFPTTPTGYRQLLGWVRKHGELNLVGVEGTGTYGVGLARHLTRSGVSVVEVDRPNRQVRRRHGKSDTVDAIGAARAALGGVATGTPKSATGAVEGIRALRLVIRSAHKSRIQAVNQLHALVLTAPDEVRERLRTLTVRKLVTACAALRPKISDDLEDIIKTALRETARRIVTLDQQIDRLTPRLQELVEATAPTLLDQPGIGPDSAAALLVAAGDNPDRLRNEGTFAALCGTNPKPASSGKTVRHRLNRGGDRQANSALWRIVLVRMGTHQPTRDYVQRRTAEGLSKREIMRCLKRYVAREVFELLPQTASS